MVKYLRTYVEPTVEKHLAEIKSTLLNDGIIAYPTDINWGVGCSLKSKKALERLKKINSEHQQDQPFSLICSSISMVSQIASFDQPVYRALKKNLPGPYTILLESQKDFAKKFKDKRKTVGVRIPQSSFLIDLINQLGHPILNTSLESILGEDVFPFRFCQKTVKQYKNLFDLVVDLGEEPQRGQTTIVDMTGGTPVIQRVGFGHSANFLG